MQTAPSLMNPNPSSIPGEVLNLPEIDPLNSDIPTGHPTAGYFSPEVTTYLARSIEEANGNEVFFFGRHREGELVEAEVVARGHQSAVPVFLERAGAHDVLIHNHPSGKLDPSEADLGVASLAGQRGLGFFIVDNSAERVYRVVEPISPSEPVDSDQVVRLFGAKGALAKSLSSFEERAGQTALAIETTEAFNHDRVVAFEAGTGVGKSFAYLIPAILWAVQNRGRVIVSTQTIALSEQLVSKDLPLLARTLGVDFRFALVKGRGNYACRRKMGEVAKERDQFAFDEEHRAWIDDILVRLESSETGSLSDLAELPPDAIWDDFRSTSDQSLKTRCPHYQECFFYNARRRAAGAHIVVVNHHLFFADLAVRMVTGDGRSDLVIPGYDRVVFDEAHRLEEVATQHLGHGFSRIGLLQLLGRWWSRGRSKKESERGRFVWVLTQMRDEAVSESREFLEMVLLPRLRDLRGSVAEAFDSARENIRSRLDASEIESFQALRLGEKPGDLSAEAIEEPIVYLRDELIDFRQILRRGFRLLDGEPFTPESKHEGLLVEYRAAISSVDKVLEAVEGLLAPPEHYVRWIELGPGDRGNLVMRLAPIRVSELLEQRLYQTTKTVAMVSATLSVRGRWDFLGDRLGWTRVDEQRFVGSTFESPFDYPNQARILLPDDLPDPGESRFVDAFAALCMDAIRGVSGRTFVLFTSHWMLREVSTQLRGRLAAWGYPVLVQGEAPATELLRRFRVAGNAVLFGNQSFWEGVDVPGDALSCVIIARLPFRVPSHPLEKARTEELRDRGENPFRSFTIPQAVLALKQGVGRLIRHTKDRGVVIIADRRITTKQYGREFLESLPDAPQSVGPWSELLRELRDFFDSESEPTEDEGTT